MDSPTVLTPGGGPHAWSGVYGPNPLDMRIRVVVGFIGGFGIGLLIAIGQGVYGQGPIGSVWFTLSMIPVGLAGVLATGSWALCHATRVRVGDGVIDVRHFGLFARRVPIGEFLDLAARPSNEAAAGLAVRLTFKTERPAALPGLPQRECDRLASDLARLTRRHCAHCGYDLRATPGRCPECGTAPAGAV